MALALAGCGGGDASRAESDVSQPIEGRAVKNTGALTGSWMRVSAGPILGFEFLKDGQVLATLGNLGRTTTLTYSVLDGGRLSLVAPGGSTTVFGTTIEDDLLELRRETGSLGGDAQRFRRVASGTTLAAAIQAHAAELQAARERRTDALREQLSAQDLVVVRSGENGPDAVIALRVQSVHPEFSGTVVMDDNPLRDDLLRPVRVHPFSGSITPMDDVTDRLRIQINVGPAVAPTGQQDENGRVVLEVAGPVDRPELKGSAQFPKSWMGEANVVLQLDDERHAAVLARLEAQEEARRRAIAQVTERLGGRAELTGRKTLQAGGEPVPVEITLERVGETGTYQTETQLGNRDGLAGRGSVEALLGEGVLFIDLPGGEQWRLELSEGGQGFEGGWRPNTRADFISHGRIELALGRVWTAAEVASEREAIARFLNVELRHPTALTGSVEAGRGGEIERWPVWVELQTAADGTASGKAWLLGQGVGVSLGGKLVGDTLQLSSSGSLEGSAPSRSFASQRWQINLKRMDPHPRLTGTMSANPGGTGSVALVPLASIDLDASRRTLIEMLDGHAFVVVNTTISRKPEPSFFRFNVDRSTGAVSGDAVGEDLTGSRPSALPPGLISGTVAEERGHAVLRLTIDGSPEPVRARPGRRFEFTVTALPGEDGPVLTGWDPPGPGNQAWLQLTPFTPSTPITVSDEQRLRLAAQRLGAMVEAPDKPAPGAQAVLLVHATERDARVGQIFTANGRYSHGNSIATAALHAGLMRPGETAVLRLTYAAPFTEPTVAMERNGVTSQRGTFRPNNVVPTFTLERVPLD